MRTYYHKEKTKSTKGYVMLYIPEHHRAEKRGRVMEHIVVWEKYHNKTIPDGCVIHHINGIKDDNRIENLMMMTNEEHTKFHHTNSKRSEQTKLKLSNWAKERLKNDKNHPRYKDIPIKELYILVQNGYSVKKVCEMYGICRHTYYKKLKKEGLF